MRDRRRAGDRKHHRRAVEEPGDLVRRPAEAFAERVPGEERDALRLARVEHVLGGQEAAAELVLHRDDARDGLRATELVERDVREADQPHLPLPAKLLERGDGFLDRHLGVVPVQLIQVDPLELQPSQARVARLPEIFRPAVADAILKPVAKASLRADHEPLRIGMQRFGDHLLADAGSIDVGGVDQRHAGVERGVEHRQRLLVVDPAAEVVRAEADDRDFRPALAEGTRAHGLDANRARRA